MPIAAIPSDPGTTSPLTSGADAAGTRTPPEPGFAELLRERRVDPRALESVTLGEMVEHLAAGSAQSATSSATRPATSSATPSRTADDWGVAAVRPGAAGRGVGAQVLAAGERYLGTPYLWGGTDPDRGFDCSGFVQQVYGDLGVSLPRVSVDQSKAGVPVDGLAAAQPGDLVFWEGTGSRPNHIGIYAGDQRMLVAPSTGDVVRYQQITRTPDAVRRVIG